MKMNETLLTMAAPGSVNPMDSALPGAVFKLQETVRKRADDLHEVRATLLCNFGPEGRDIKDMLR